MQAFIIQHIMHHTVQLRQLNVSQYCQFISVSFLQKDLSFNIQGYDCFVKITILTIAIFEKVS